MTQTQVLKQLNMYTHNIHNNNILQLTRRACHNNYGISTRPVHVKVFAIQLSTTFQDNFLLIVTKYHIVSESKYT